MKKSILLGVLTSLCFFVYAQDSLKNPLINSGQLIADGISFHDKGLYDSAIAKYNQVDRNDTNYTNAMYEKSYSLLMKKDYAATIKTLREALKNPYEETVELYMNLGTALDDSGALKESESVYIKAINEYPYLYLLRYNYALNLINQKKMNEAELQFQKAINLNPYHASSYMALGTLYYNEGRKIPAMLALGMFLVIEPNTGRSLNVTKMLKRIVDGSIDQDKDVVKNIPEDDKKYSNLVEIIESKVANDVRYKTGIDVNDILVRQFHVMLSNLTYDDKDTSFISKNLVAYMKEMFTSKHFETFVYYMFCSYNNDKINKWIKKNEKAIAEFKNWNGQKIEDMHTNKIMFVDGKPEMVHCYFRNNGRLLSFGKQKTLNGKDLRQGQWTFLSQSGNVETVVGYNDKGESDGRCKSWYENRRLMKDFFLKNDKEDSLFLQYFDNGNLQFKTTYKRGLLEGNLYKYYNSGGVKSIEPFIHDTLNGWATYFNQSGCKSAELKYVKGETDSLARYFYPSGKIKSTVWFKNDKRNGKTEYYYENGQLQSKGEYKNEEQIGQWIAYWDNGKVKSEATYSQDGLLTGEYKEYNETGVLTEDDFYLNGKLNGKSSNYTDEARLWYNVDYKNSIIKRITTFTANTGAVCAEFEDKGKKIPVTFMTPKCQKMYEGLFFEGERDGAWTYFYTNGNISLKEAYKKGLNEGMYISYFKNGVVNSKINFTKDKKNGYYIEYYKNGVKSVEGWYRNGQKQGYWISYGETGLKSKELYYLNDEMRGYQRYYTIDGKLDYEMYLRNGLTETYTYYDTTGTVAFENRINNGQGHVVATYFNGKKRFECDMKNASFDGLAKRYYPNGALFEECNYKAGEIDGVFKQYHRQGSVLKTGTYINGDIDGTFTWYYENGKPETIGTYKKNVKNGVWEWFDESGRKTVTRYYKDDDYDGEHIWYDSTGTAMIKKVYEHDDLIAYSYLDKNKVFVPNIPVQDETAQIKTFYPNGSVAIEMEYKKGIIVGEFKNYYQSGKIMEITPYENDKITGVSKTFYENGKIRSEENYIFGNKHGKSSFYRLDGTLERIEHWYLDEKHGVFEYYDLKGKLVKKQNYVYGELFE